MRSVLVLSAVALGLVGFATPADAAKGVKKAKAVKPTQVTGVVTHVKHPSGKVGVGSITITTVGSKKKGAAAGKVAGQAQTFTLASTTTVVAGHNGQTRVVPTSALKTGEHVTIRVDGGQAQAVTIHTPNIRHKKSGVRRVAVKKVR